MTTKPILIVEDDEMLNAGLCYNLKAENFAPEPAFNAAAARQLLSNQDWALVVLDINLPDGSGIDLCRQIRATGKTPVIFLTACDLDEDMLKGFEAGGDDYITKPFNVKIFIQRVRAILRRCEAETDTAFRCGCLEVDFDRLTAQKNGEPLLLTPTEFKLLRAFTSNSGRVLTRRILLEQLWDNEGNFVDEHTLTIHISRLRSKIEDGSFQSIKTVYGMGYQWVGDQPKHK